MHALQAAGIAAAAVLDAAEVIDDPHLRARGFVTLDDHPAASTSPVAGVPWLYDGERPGLRHAPLLGDATDEILAETDGIDVESLRLEGVLV
jgi:crotonobetainyl-CoA:carnitine CoA-transferase CaiB-like acyl-CoA transferase